MFMSMNTSARVEVSSRQVILITMEGRCPICATTLATTSSGATRHACNWSCPAKMLSLYQWQLEDRRTGIDCPKCRQPLGLNGNDFYECIECHHQYTTGYNGDESWENLILINETADKIANAILQVRVLPQKGKGDFPVTQELERLIKNAKRAYGRMDRLLKGMRRQIGEKNLFFNGNEFFVPGSTPGKAVQQMLIAQKYCTALT